MKQSKERKKYNKTTVGLCEFEIRDSMPLRIKCRHVTEVLYLFLFFFFPVSSILFLRSG